MKPADGTRNSVIGSRRILNFNSRVCGQLHRRRQSRQGSNQIMAVREIKVIDEPVLRRKAKKVEKITAEVRKLIEDMIDTMRAAPGVGLAAPQVGVSERVIVVEYAEDEDDDQAAEQDVPPKKKKLYA